MAAINPFSSSNQASIDGPYEHAAAVTLHDTNTLTHVSSALLVGSAGNLKVDMFGGETVTINNIAAGTVLLIRATKCYSTGSTASNVTAFW